MVRAYIDHRIARVGKIGTFEVSITEQCPFEIAQTKVRFLKRPIAKIDLFSSTLPHYQSLQIQTEKVAVVEDTLRKSKRISIEQTLPIRHRPIDPYHLARAKLDIAHFTTGQFHEAQITVFETAFGKFAGGEKGLAKIARDKRAIIEFGFGDLFAVEINTLKFLGEYVHVVGDGFKCHRNKALFKCLLGHRPFSFQNCT